MPEPTAAVSADAEPSGAATEGDATAKFRVHIAGPIEAVWAEITRTDAPILAFFNSRMHANRLAPGARLAMRTANGRYTGVVGEIVEFEPPRRFAHTFRFTAYDDPECTVVYDLEEQAGGTLFTLTIRDLPAGTKTAKQMVQGGKMITSTLKSVIETGRAPFGIRLLYLFFDLMAPATPKRSRSEHWPID
ncbi:MAG: hypothetical protein DWQ36_01585 [Acidobacteria bacterium]|nr:MAG: hypothetical protein DWQ30_14375 [Acidobacteriota bacterium]REK11698.1 MAG: hypothetical protein DWQ36_01585 [Acidobacteriota bacterium]